MASTVKDEQVTEPQDDAPEPEESKESKSLEYRRQGAEQAKEPGFFHIYKKGQGYWTRMGSAGAALLLAALIVNFLWTNLPVWIRPALDNASAMADTDPAKPVAI